MTFAAASVASPALRAQATLEKPRLVLAVDGKAAFSYLPLTIAEQMGYFRAEGLDVEFMDVPSVVRAQKPWGRVRPISLLALLKARCSCKRAVNFYGHLSC